MLKKAAASSADALLPDLEDSVQPAANKEVARKMVNEMVGAGRLAALPVFPRVNDRESGHLLKDVGALTIAGVSGFVYPKTQTGEDIHFFAKLLETIEYEKGFPVGQFKIIALIETTAAVLNALEICQASERIIGIGFGCEDFIADLQGVHDEHEESLFTPRALIAMAARASGVIPIDTVHIDVHDLEDLEKNLVVAKNLGFEGAFALHPQELPLLHRIFSPTEQEVNDAREILDLSEEAKKKGKGVVMMNGKFIGPPIITAAKQVLRKHKLIVERDQ
jgi:citrate lyase subunit beta/citryl-CoA lyase